jgi:multiple sugar transport system substrate-binding protein
MHKRTLSRRTFLRLTAMGGAGLLAACGGAPQAPAPSAPAQNEQVGTSATSAPAAAKPALAGEISYFTYDLGPANASREEAITAFQAAHPGATIKLTVLPYEELWQKVGAQMAAGQPPDVIYGDFSLVRAALQGELLDLSERIAADDVLGKPELFTTNLTDEVQAKYGTDGVRALIMGTWVPILYYNRELFDAAGVAYPTDEWTWEDLRGAAQQLTKPDDEQYGLQFGTNFDNVGWMWWSQRPENFWALPQVFPSTTAFDSPAGLGLFEVYRALGFEDKSAIPIKEAETYEVYAGGFGAGKVAMYTGGDWDAGWSFRELPFAWGMTLTPKMLKDYRPALNTMLSTNVISAKSQNPDLAWAFARFLTASPEGQTIIGKGAYETPVLREVASSDAILKPDWAAPGYDARVRAAEIDGPMFTPYPLSLNLWEFPEKHLNPTVEKVMTGELSPQEAVAYLDAEGRAHFAQQAEELKSLGVGG